MKETAELLAEEQLHERQDLVRGLKDRHIQLIAIGGAIGVGLFLGSARAIQSAGPGLLLAYAFGAVIVFFLARALGELLLYRRSQAPSRPTPRSSSAPGPDSSLAGPTG
jgi:AAT family amino acid transporter/D-serine/D-alanine/glycine transporter